jgi:hypothetical protein
VLVAVAACEPDLPPTPVSRKTLPAPQACVTGLPPKPRAFIGPDVKLKVTCGAMARAAVASVSDEGTGITEWHAALSGDAAFSLVQSDFASCGGGGPLVADVDFTPPTSAVPGDTFDAVVTVSADQDAFPTTTVKVHGEVVAPVVVSDKSMVDFGDVETATLVTQELTFRVDTIGLRVQAPPADYPFTIQETQPPMSTLATYAIRVLAGPRGDYTMPAVWTVGADPMVGLPEACVWRKTIPIHARIVVREDQDGGVDAGPDAGSDGP